MTQREYPAGAQDHPEWMTGGQQLAEEPEVRRPSPDRTRTANEVGSAIAHQLNGPLTALRLYVGEIRQNIGGFHGTAETQDGMQQIVELAFQETERVCAMLRLITSRFEARLQPETAAAVGRDVIGWWSRTASASAGDSARATFSQPIQTLLTPREREVLSHVLQGCSNKQGAIRMQIVPRTFECHRAQVMRKLGAKNGADLVRMVLSENPVTS
jgi:DNA-binding CsgD family transcriptional regulator